MNRTLLLLTLLSPGLLASPARAQSLTSPPADGMVWELQSMTDGERATSLKPGLNNPSLQFTGKAAIGNTFCNSYRAGYASRADLLRFGPAVTTRRACLPQTANLENLFLKLLQGTNRYTISGNVLTLYSGADGRLVFQKRSGAKPVQPTATQTPPAANTQSPGNTQPTAGMAMTGTLPSAATLFDRVTATDLGPDEDLLIVGPLQQDCTGVAAQRCLIVKHPGEATWSLFYSQIQGFTFRPGVTSLLRVRVERVAQPAADGSNVRYRLVRVLGTQNVR